MPSLKELKENYRGFSDSKIENIARNESKGLMKEVLPILKEEIIRRKLDQNLISWIDTEANPFEGVERKQLIQTIKSQRCPKCNSELELFGFETNSIKSFLFFTCIEKREYILCKSCGVSKKLTAIVTTLLLGWWSPKGFLSTPFILITDIINFMYLNKISKRIINDFIDETNGTIRRYGSNDDVIKRLIQWKNKSSK